MNETPASPLNPSPAPAPNGRISLRLPTVNPIITYGILSFTILIFLLQFISRLAMGGDILIVYGAKDNAAIRAGELWRLFTPMFLHDPNSIWHIGFNMYALFSLGSGLERRLGHWRFLLLYVLSGFAGNVFSFLITPQLSIGASTSIFGLIAAEGVFLFQNRKLFGREFRGALNNIIFVILFNLFLGFSSGGLIDNWGHIGGLLGGMVFTWYAGPVWDIVGIYPDVHLADKREYRDVVLGAGTVIIIFGALAWWGIFR